MVALFGQYNLSLGQRSPNCLGAPGLFKAPQSNPKYTASTHRHTSYAALLIGELALN
jgi:hypothetical protein